MVKHIYNAIFVINYLTQALCALYANDYSYTIIPMKFGILFHLASQQILCHVRTTYIVMVYTSKSYHIGT